MSPTGNSAARPLDKRAFRSAESYEAERATRDMVAKYLSEHGLSDLRDERKSFGQTEQQTIRARMTDGSEVAARVRLCWRRNGRKSQEHTYSAAQLLAKIDNGDWQASLGAKVSRDLAAGITHILFVQRDGEELRHAALIPVTELISIWQAQHDISAELINSGNAGRRKQNHAKNGSSPTIWLQDDEAPAVSEVLWTWPGVLDLNKSGFPTPTFEPLDDTYDDLPGVEYSTLGSDGAARVVTVRSQVKRDPRVRAAVLVRSQGRCEVPGCGAFRAFIGFLDVHHILGVGRSDRVSNCVALCPNCHREAHFSPDRDQINQQLLHVASSASTRHPTNAR